MNRKLHRNFLRIAQNISPQLHNHMQRLGPIQLPNRKSLGLAKFLARVIIGQQLSTKAARTIWTRVQEAAKESGDGVPGFFTVKNLEAVRACGVSGNKAKALIAINDAVIDGRLSAARVRRMDATARNAMLHDLHGVGQWTVDMASMFYFGDTDIWPAGDLSVSRTFASYLSKKQLHRTDLIVAAFSPHRSYLAMYMWQIVDGVP